MIITKEFLLTASELDNLPFDKVLTLVIKKEVAINWNDTLTLNKLAKSYPALFDQKIFSEVEYVFKMAFRVKGSQRNKKK